MSEEEELRRLIAAITAYALPKSILLFGSRTKGLARAESDFALCIIYNQLPKRSLEVMQDLYRSIFSIAGHPVDLVVYQADRFNVKALREGTLESAIRAEGQVVYG